MTSVQRHENLNTQEFNELCSLVRQPDFVLRYTRGYGGTYILWRKSSKHKDHEMLSSAFTTEQKAMIETDASLWQIQNVLDWSEAA